MPHIETPVRYTKLPKYPHLSPVDVGIWERFIAENPDRFTRVWYDFRIGDEDEIPEGTPHDIGQCWWDLTYWRIDVVCEDDETIYVVEIKPMANSKAIGQALAYAKIFENDEEPTKPVIPVVLTDRITPTAHRVATALGVSMWAA